MFSGLVGLLLVIVAPMIIPFGLRYIARGGSLIKKEAYFFGATANILLFLLAVVYPYYVEGYSKITEAVPGEPIGITAYPIIQQFAYFYSSIFWGVYWHIVSLLLLVIPHRERRHIVINLVSAILVILVSLVLIRQEEFARTISVVLE